MPLSRRNLFVLLPLAFGVVATVAQNSRSSESGAAELVERSERMEVRRIHAHFDSVLKELPGRDVSSLSINQRARRAALVETLRGYNERGVFPHNYDFAQPTPYFIDRKTGTLCAVAFLLESTGRRDIVDRVSQANNNVWVAELKGDSAFGSWLVASGITLEEAARIQVPYMDSQQGSRDWDSTTPTSAYVFGIASLIPPVASLGFTAWNALGNSNGHSRNGAIAGLTAGAATTAVSIIIGVQSSQRNNSIGAVGAGVALGVTSMAFATRSLVHRNKLLAASKHEENVKRGNVEANVSPILPMGKNGSTGLSLNIRF